jgi:hypothetical protein
MLTSSSDGELCDNNKGHGGRQGELLMMSCTSLTTHNDDGRIKVKTTDFWFASQLTCSI